MGELRSPWQAKACPTHAAQPPGNGQTPAAGFSWLLPGAVTRTWLKKPKIACPTGKVSEN
jgi:hypothetical protein